MLLQNLIILSDIQHKGCQQKFTGILRPPHNRGTSFPPPVLMEYELVMLETLQKTLHRPWISNPANCTDSKAKTS
jgi:hypothetical protein